MHDDKLCHYHKMDMVVLDGSEGWGLNNTYKNSCQFTFWKEGYIGVSRSTPICNTMISHITDGDVSTTCIWLYTQGDKSKNCFVINTPMKSVNELKQWLSENPTTVVYELAEPWYEEIEPIQEDLILTVFNDSDLTLNTVIPPITTVTYSTNISSVTCMATELEQNQEVQNEQDAMIIDNAVAIATMQLTL